MSIRAAQTRIAHPPPLYPARFSENSQPSRLIRVWGLGSCRAFQVHSSRATCLWDEVQVAPMRTFHSIVQRSPATCAGHTTVCVSARTTHHGANATAVAKHLVAQAVPEPARRVAAEERALRS